MDNKELVEYLKKNGWIQSKRVEKAFLSTDRSLFVPKELRVQAFQDIPLPIGFGQTISQPTVVALMSEKIDARVGQRVLEVGTGSGYQTAILSKLVGGKGMVYSTEIVPQLFESAKEKIKLLKLRNVKLFLVDGSKGLPNEAPFDRILVAAAAPDVPSELFKQVREGGKMVLPVGSPWAQELLLVQKIKGKKLVQSVLPVAFVPLVSPPA